MDDDEPIMEELEVRISQVENGYILDTCPGRRIYKTWPEAMTGLAELFDIVQEGKI